MNVFLENMLKLRSGEKNEQILKPANPFVITILQLSMFFIFSSDNMKIQLQ